MGFDENHEKKGQISLENQRDSPWKDNMRPD